MSETSDHRDLDAIMNGIDRNVDRILNVFSAFETRLETLATKLEHTERGAESAQPATGEKGKNTTKPRQTE